MKSKLTARELSNFCGQMGILLHSGISTTEGLHILCENQAKKPVVWMRS